MCARTCWLATAVCLFAAVPPAPAQTWTGAVNGNWSNSSNWTGGVPVSGSNTVLTFGAATTLTMSNDIANPLALNELIFQSTASTLSLNSGGVLNFVSTSGSVLPSIVMNASASQIIFTGVTLTNNLSITGTGAGMFSFASNNLSGAGSLTMAGAGTLGLGDSVLNGGGLFVTAGTIQMAAGGSLQAGENVTASGTGTFNPTFASNTSGTALNALTISGGGKFVATGTGNYFVNKLIMTAGTVDLSGATNYTMHISGSGAAVTTNTSAVGAVWLGPTGSGNNAYLSNDTGAALNITINGGGPGLAGIDLDCGLALIGSSFVKAGPGLMRLTNLNSTANITSQGGYVRVDDATTNGVGALGTGTFSLNGGFVVYGGLTNATTTKPIALGASGGGFGILNAGVAWTINGLITQSAAGTGINVNGFRVTGAPTTVVFGNANNSYSQLTVIQDGATLQIPTITNEGSSGGTASPIGASSNATGNLILGDGSVSSAGRGTLLLSPATPGTFSTDRGLTVNGQYATGAGGAIGVASGSTLTINGQVIGSGALIKTSAGTLTLGNNNNSYAGGTFIEGGVLSSASSVVNPLPSGGAVTVQNGATLDLRGYTGGEALGTVNLNGGTVRIATNTSISFSQLVTNASGGAVDATGVSGAGGLTFQGSNPGITVNGNSTWTGPNTAYIMDNSSAPLAITIANNVTLTSNLSLDGPAIASFQLTGGGTLHLTNTAKYSATVTVAQSTLQIDDLTSIDSLGSFAGTGGTIGLTLDRGTLKYTGGTTNASSASTLTLFAISANGGTLDVEGTANIIVNQGYVIAGPAGATLTKSGPGTFTIGNGGSPAIPGGVTVAGGTFSLDAGKVLPTGANVTIKGGAVFDTNGLGNDSSSAIGTVSISGLPSNPGIFRAFNDGNSYFLNQLVINSTGGNIVTSGLTPNDQNTGFIFSGAGTGITVNGNSQWSGSSGFFIGNDTSNFGQMPITIAPGVTVTSGLSFVSVQGFETNPFLITGGGTLYLTNAPQYYAQVTVSGARLRLDDLTNVSSSLALTLDDGTLQYGGGTMSYPASFALTGNGGTLEVLNSSTTLTITGAITSAGTFTKAGPGTLILGNSGNIIPSLYVAAGTLQITNDGALGTGPINVGPLGTVFYPASMSTSRTFNLLSGTIVVSAGQTLTLTNATIGGGFLAGPGTYAVAGASALTGVTTYASTSINVTGAATFTDFTNGGVMTGANGVLYSTAAGALPAFSRFTNQGSGSITLGADSRVTVSDFQTYGLLNVPNGLASKTLFMNVGTTPLYFNGGSRTFIGTIGGNTALAGLELNGQNAIVAGGLFVNNGQVTDNSILGVSTIIADYGALVKGAGQYDNSPITRNGGKFQAGNSPGVATVGRFVFGPGGVSNYIFAIDDATGQAGPTPDALGHVSGWGLVKAAQWQRTAGPTSGDFVWTADASHPLTVAIDTLVNPTTVGTDVPGLMADFDPTRSYSWPAVQWTGTYSGPTNVAALDAATNFDTSGFANPITGTFGWSLSVAQVLNLSYTPSAVPEPGTMALVGIAAAAGWWHRRWKSVSRS